MGEASGQPGLWAPWRMQYLRDLTAVEANTATAGPMSPACFLCEAGAVPAEDIPGPGAGSEQAARRLVLHRDEHGTILLNRYPYSNGHLLIAPLSHVSDLSDLDAAGRAALMELTDRACRTLRLAMNPQGLNVGINLGRCAGAGVPGHVHIHVVPRWNGDTNFMQVVGRIRVIPQALEESYAVLCEAMAKV